VPPEERVLPRFAAEPTQEGLPEGRWSEHLAEEFLASRKDLREPPSDLGEPGEIAWYPERSWHGRTYVPGTARTAGGYELFGFVRFVSAATEDEPRDFRAQVDFTEETAERNPDWTLDICDEVIGSWRGEAGDVAAMTLVWGRPLIAGGAIATAELDGVTVDQCELTEGRFTLIAPDDYGGQLLEITLYGPHGQELARESLYAGEDEDEAGEDEEDDEEEQEHG
jgi:hypothetical protein